MSRDQAADSGQSSTVHDAVLDACGWVPSGPASPFESATDD